MALTPGEIDAANPTPPPSSAPTGAPADVGVPAGGKTGWSPASGDTPTSGWIFPVAGASPQYSNSFTVPRDNSYGIHGAIDIYGSIGDTIVCPVGGTVKASGYSSIGGHWIQIRGDDGIIYYFAHMNGTPTINSGRVEAGMPIGAVGDSGNASGTTPHLHLKMSYPDGSLVNPYDFLQNGEDAYQNLSQTPDGSYVYDAGGAGGAGSSGESDAAINLPTGGKFYTVGGSTYAAYSIKGNDGVGKAWVYYDVTGTDAPAGDSMSEQQWEATTVQNGWIDGGTGEVFRGVDAGTSWDDMIERTLMAMGIFGTDAMDDPGVLAVIAEFIGRPDMGPTELQTRLEQTDWYREHTDRERSWNDKSEAQQAQEIVDQAMSLVGTWFTYVGESIDIMSYDANGDGTVTDEELKAGNPDLYKYAHGIASGTMTSREIVETWVKPAALDTDYDSPWQRVLRDEEQAQGQYETDVETAAAQVQGLYRDYGIPITWDEALKIADQVEMNVTSIAEVEQSLDEQAMALYPGKAPGVKTITYASPYMQQYKQLLEVPDVGLDDPKIQAAMSQGQTLGDFANELRADPRWMETANARDTHYTTMGQLSRQMGF